MSKIQLTLRQQLEQFDRGDFPAGGCYNFYDWFCRETSLEVKSDKLFRKLKRFLKVVDVDLDTHYVWFKNCCPMNGSLYDIFVISAIDTGMGLYAVTPKSGHKCHIDNPAQYRVCAGKDEGKYVEAANFSKLLKALK